MSESVDSAPLKSRRRVLLIVCVLAAALSASALLAMRHIKSPQQVAAETAPPDQTVLTEPVALGHVSDAVVMPGEVSASATVAVNPGSPPQGMLPVVTRAPVHSGAEVRSGTVILEVAGRPTFILEGKIPMYRDIFDGDIGPDVAVLQTALKALGYYRAKVDSIFGPETQRALQKMYETAGYSVPVAVPSESPANRGGGDGVDKPLVNARESEPREVPLASKSELRFAPSLPARVLASKVKVGTEVSSPALTLTTRPLGILGQVNTVDSGRIREGQSAEITLSSGKIVRARVVGKGAQQQSESLGAVIPVRMEPVKPIEPSQLGSSVQVRVLVETTDEKALVVPVAAVSTSSGGQTFVLVQHGADVVRVPLRVEVVGDGFLAVVPLSDDALAAGDRVVVGHAQ